MSSCRLSPLPDFLSGVEGAWIGDAAVGMVGEGALSMPEAEVVGIDDGANVGEAEYEKGLWLDGGRRPSEFLRMRGVDEERGTGSEPDEARAGVCGGCRLAAAGCGRGLGE